VVKDLEFALIFLEQVQETAFDLSIGALTSERFCKLGASGRRADHTCRR
jgi:hypothetical protein